MKIDLPQTHPVIQVSVDTGQLIANLSIEKLKELATEIRKEISRKEKEWIQSR